MAQNILFWLGVTKPSYVIDTGCSSSFYAVVHAYQAIRRAIMRLLVLNQDGRCKIFDENANGYIHSEGISVAFLQKAKTAKRIYATIIHMKTNCDDYKEEGITFPSNKMQSTLFKESYDECNVSTTCIPYIEGHGTGTRVDDHEELNVIDHIFTNCKANVLKIGSIILNIGHTEGTSGIYSIDNTIILMELGLIPPNINFNRPPKNLKAHLEGQIEVVIQQTSLIIDCIDINSSGFGGANAHVLLKSNPKIKLNNRLPDDDLPKFVAILRRV
uniref:fatty acid synthase-like n=1 Tax=Vespula vulgaris TaxID=7454 RepID=UPI00223C0EE9|nr:fatty acid synthase-like [Vespula vulgaris]